MESPVVLDKPPEYHGKSDERGFPFDEEEGSGAWSSLAARHPDIAARLRQRPAAWARKRRPSSQDAGDDFGDRFGDFDRFPFDDIPPEFRDHFPAHWGRRFEEPPPQNSPPQQSQTHQQHQHPQQQPSSPQPQQSSAATQTESDGPAAPHLPQYGLRNTVDLGQKTAPEPSADADGRSQRSSSAPPAAAMSSHEPPPPDHHSNVRHIPIFVEGRDEPVINKTEHEPKPHYAPPPHVDREAYFADDGPASFHHPPNFSRAFGTPFNKGFRQGPQPFVQQKVYPQTAFTRGASPQRSQSPKAPPAPEEQPKHEPAPRAQPPAPQQPAQPPQPPQPQAQPHAASPPPPKAQPTPKDPISIILSIQTDVLNLMSEVENFVGTKKDKKYIYLDEMLTRNLIKLDNIETEGKDNIRQARKEAIKCIEKCIAVLEAKADGRTAAPPAPPDNGEVDMKEAPAKEDSQDTQEMTDVTSPGDPHKPEEQPQAEAKPEETKEETKPQAADTRPEENRAVLVEKPQDNSEEADKKASPKKSTKKRDKSKDKSKDSNKRDAEEKQVESMQVDDKGDKAGPQQMEVDGAAASQ